MNDLKTQRVLEDYPSRTSTDIRFADLDRQGHVNNAVFATFSEVGRVAFMYDPERPLVSKGRSFVIARLLIDFRAELFWPGTVDIGTGVVRAGCSSSQWPMACPSTTGGSWRPRGDDRDARQANPPLDPSPVRDARYPAEADAGRHVPDMEKALQRHAASPSEHRGTRFRYPAIPSACM